MTLESRFHQLKAFVPFLKYCAVGVAGTTVDVVTLWLCVEMLGIAVIPASVIAFLVAVVHNYVLNKLWTFKVRSTNHRKLFIKFLIVSSVGLGLTVALMYLFVEVFDIWYVAAKLMTSAVVLSWNFLANKYWTFRIVKRDSELDEPRCELGIVIPAFNEEDRIVSTLEAVMTYVNTLPYSCEVLVVDDGSRDGTRAKATYIANKHVNCTVIHYDDNRGKGHAVRTGILNASSKYVLFMDADHCTPVGEIEHLLPLVKGGSCDVAIGSRYLRSDSVKIEQPALRRLIGSVGNRIIQLFLIDGIRDTQCGFKLFTREAAHAIFSRQKVKRWGFDMEALLLAQLLGYRVREVAVDWYHVEGSRFRPVRGALLTFWELIYIKLNEWSGRYE